MMVFVLALPLSAHASALECATKLPPDARLVFNATAPDIRPGVVLRDAIKAHTSTLVMTGRLMMANARPAAIAAANCLKQLPH